MEAPVTARYFHTTLKYPLTFSQNDPFTAFLPMDVLRILRDYCDRATVEVLFATSRRWRVVAAEVPRLKDAMCGVAAFWGYQKVILWARSNNAPWQKKKVGEKRNRYNTCEMAILGKHPKVFQWARDEQAPYSKTLCMGAAVCMGDLELMEELWSAKKSNSGKEGAFSEPHILYSSAAEYGQLEALQWLHKKYNLVIRAPLVETAVMHGHVPIVNWGILQGVLMSYQEIVRIAARTGQLGVLQWIYVDHKKIWTKDVATEAAQSSNVGMLKWLSTLPECIFNSRCLEIAAAHDNLAGLQFLRSKDIPWPHGICNSIVSTAVLSWALQNGAQASPETALNFSRRNRFDLVRCLWQNNTSIDSQIILNDPQVDNRSATEFFRALDRERRGES